MIEITLTVPEGAVERIKQSAMNITEEYLRKQIIPPAEKVKEYQESVDEILVANDMEQKFDTII